MGLDSTVYAQTPGNIIEPVKVAYWRKNWDMHNWFAELAVFKEQIDPDDDFNCQDCRFDIDDLDCLEMSLPNFQYQPDYAPYLDYGDTYQSLYPSEWNTPYQVFLERARKLLNEGWILKFSSWY